MRLRNRAIVLTAAAAMTLAAWPAVLAAPSALQESAQTAKPATVRLEAYIEAFNSGSVDRMKAFFEKHFAASALKETPVERRMTRYQGGRLQLKSFAVEKIVGELPYQTSVLTKAGNGAFIVLKAIVEKAPPHKLVAIQAERVDDPAMVSSPDPMADEAELVAAVREHLGSKTAADEFSGVVLVARNDRVVFHEAYGSADRDKAIPNRKDTKFNLGSINKNFTRVAVLQLANRGRLSLDDTIGKFLPSYPNARAAGNVTIRHLLNMTSGIGDFFGDRYDATPKEKIRTLQDYLPLFADLPLEFKPGTANRYSNGGYLVLGLIIEKAAGMDYYDYVRENIFKPCGMLDTDSFPRDADTPNLALGYTREEADSSELVLNHATLPGRGSSAGGGYSTAGDMLNYILAVKEGKIHLPDAASGLGIAGGAPGINATVEWDPRTGWIVIVLTNLDPPAAGLVSRRIVAWLPL
jgi:D-alanyl-D-alanine carboxypeptidase